MREGEREKEGGQTGRGGEGKQAAGEEVFLEMFDATQTESDSNNPIRGFGLIK